MATRQTHEARAPRTREPLTRTSYSTTADVAGASMSTPMSARGERQQHQGRSEQLIRSMGDERRLSSMCLQQESREQIPQSARLPRRHSSSSTCKRVPAGTSVARSMQPQDDALGVAQLSAAAGMRRHSCGSLHPSRTQPNPRGAPQSEVIPSIRRSVSGCGARARAGESDRADACTNDVQAETVLKLVDVLQLLVQAEGTDRTVARSRRGSAIAASSSQAALKAHSAVTKDACVGSKAQPQQPQKHWVDTQDGARARSLSFDERRRSVPGVGFETAVPSCSVPSAETTHPRWSVVSLGDDSQQANKHEDRQCGVRRRASEKGNGMGVTESSSAHARARRGSKDQGQSKPSIAVETKQPLEPQAVVATAHRETKQTLDAQASVATPHREPRVYKLIRAQSLGGNASPVPSGNDCARSSSFLTPAAAQRPRRWTAVSHRTAPQDTIRRNSARESYPRAAAQTSLREPRTARFSHPAPDKSDFNGTPWKRPSQFSSLSCIDQNSPVALSAPPKTSDRVPRVSHSHFVLRPQPVDSAIPEDAVEFDKSQPSNPPEFHDQAGMRVSPMPQRTACEVNLPLPPSSESWDWPLSRAEKKSRITMLDQNVLMTDKLELTEIARRLAEEVEELREAHVKRGGGR